GSREAGVVSSNGEVTRGDELATGGRCDAMDLRDDRLRQFVKSQHHLDTRREQLFVELAVAVVDDLGKVMPCREDRSAPLDDEAACCGVATDAVEGIEHLAHHGQR